MIPQGGWDHIEEFDLHEFFDGRGSPAWRDRLEGHLSTCEECRSRFNRLEILMARIESLPDIDLETDLSLSVMNSLSTEKKSWAASHWLLAGQAVFALILLFLSWSLIERLLALEQGWLILDPGFAVDWIGHTSSMLVSSLGETITSAYSIVTTYLSQIPAAPAGVNLWAIAAACGLLWLAIHARLLRPGQPGKDDQDSA